MNSSFLFYAVFMSAIPSLFFIAILIIWIFWIRFHPAKSSMVKIKFDYITQQTSFYSKSTVIGAILFWFFLLFIGITASDAWTTGIILGIISAVYLSYILRYLSNRRNINRFKKTATKMPGKIVGLKEHTTPNYSYKHNRRHSNWHANLIVEYENPFTLQKEEYVTREEVNCNPFYYLKSLEVTVYYLDAKHIWVEDFKRIDNLTDNIAYQVTGSVDGKDPGVLRYETKEKE